MNVPKEGARSFFCMLSPKVSLATIPMLPARPFRGGGIPHLPRGTPGSHNLPELQPQGHKPRASSVAEGEMFQVTVSAVKKVHEPAGPAAEGGACARRRGPRGCFLLPDCPTPSSEAGQTGKGRRHAEGLLPG